MADWLRRRKKTKTTRKKTRTLKGCLQKGDDAKEYKLTAEKDATSETRSDSVNLREHVGHTVRNYRRGFRCAMKEDAKDAASEHGVDKDSTEQGHLRVTNLSMVGESYRE